MAALISIPETFTPIAALLVGGAVFGLVSRPVPCLLLAAAINSAGFLCSRRLANAHNALKVVPWSVVGLYFLAFLFGAPLVQNWDKTLAWSVFTASYCALPLALHNAITAESIREVLVLRARYLQDEDAILLAWNAMLFNWVGSCVIPLDWNRAWQKWPIPNAVCGSLSLLAYQLSSAYIQHARQQDNDLKSKIK